MYVQLMYHSREDDDDDDYFGGHVIFLHDPTKYAQPTTTNLPP